MLEVKEKIGNLSKKKKEQQQPSNYTKPFRLRNTLNAIDIFSKPVPVFNIRGRKAVPTICGTMMTLIIAIILVLYSSIKFV